MFEFFSSGSVFFVFEFLKRDILLVWHFALPRVFCVCLCCLELLNTLCFTMVRLDVALFFFCWLTSKTSLFFCFLLLCRTFQGFDFHSTQTENCQFSSNLFESVVARGLFFRSKASLYKSCEIYTSSVCLRHVFSSSPAFFSSSLGWNHRCGMKICSVFCSFFFFTWEPKNYRHSIQILKHGVLTWC